MRLQYGGWEPDSVSVGATDANGAVLLEEARNVFAGRYGYKPMLSLGAVADTALPAGCRGLVVARLATGAHAIFAGTATKLYKYNTTDLDWDDYTRTAGGDYSLAAGDYWSFDQFGNLLLAVAPGNDPQKFDVDGVGVNFAALGGSPPRGRYVKVIGSFVFIGALDSNDRKIQNSALENAEGWTAGTNLSDIQEFVEHGAVTGIHGGEFGWIAQEHAIRRMTFHAGADIAFTYDEIETEKGASAPYASLTMGNRLFFRGDDGFYAHDGQTLHAIGNTRVDDWFNANSDVNRYDEIQVFFDPTGSRVIWAFHSSSNSTYFDRLLLFDWELNKWTYSTQGAQFWASLTSAAWTLEGVSAAYPNLETVPFSLDSRVWAGGRPTVGAVSTTGFLGFLEGSPLTALLRTGSIQFNAGKRTSVRSIEPIGTINGATVTGRIGRREQTADATSYVNVSASSRTGVLRTKASGRLHRLELTVTQNGGTNWGQIRGLEVDLVPAGER
jgi:hypothetical protein